MALSTIDTSSISGLGYGFKNRILNGSMVFDQRNAGASVSTASGSSAYTLDRWTIEYSQFSKFTLQQNAGSVTPPSGFTNYLGVTSSSAYSVLSTDYFLLEQRIEGFNSADLAWGTASAATITVSFWVRSSLTGAFGGAVRNNAGTRSYPFSFTVSAANTWEQKTVTVPGDTTGAWLTTNGIGLRVALSLGMGSTYTATAGSWAAGNFLAPTGATSVVGTNGATFYITGVQLEKGTVATSFDYRPYTTELQLCQRYFCKSSNINVVAVNGAAYNTAGMFLAGSVSAYAANAAYAGVQTFPVFMRAEPSTVTLINTSLVASPTAGNWSIYNPATGWVNGSAFVQTSTQQGFTLNFSGVWAAGAIMWFGAWTASAEL
jgi:hypothetical protein